MSGRTTLTGVTPMCLQRRVRVIAVVAAAATLCIPSVEAAATAATLKAAFLYNFVKFTEWPAEVLAPGQRLSLWVSGDASVADALELTIKGRVVEGHELTVQIVKLDPSSAPLSCHLLYVAAGDLKKSAAVLADLPTVPILTVSDGDNFAESGGIAALVTEEDHMRFSVNVTAADRARLRISSKLLSLAHIVKSRR